MTPAELLDHAGSFLLQPVPSMRRCWQRGCAGLTRIALEQGLRQHWQTVEPSVAECNMRHQLIVLPHYLDPALAYTARTAWYGLSRALHHHTYELAPTAAELWHWHADVQALLPQLKGTIC